MQIYSTSDIQQQYNNILVYGGAGSGKTPLAATAPSPIIISSEPGLKSLARYKLPYVQATNYKESMEAYKWVVGSREAQQFQTVYYDSISATSENELMEQKKKSSDARKYSPETYAHVMEIVLLFQAIRNKHIVMTSKAIEKSDAVTGQTTSECFAAVPKLGPALPYNFDDVLFIKRFTNPDGSEYSALCCRANPFSLARNRSGMLDLWEPANIQHIINKSNGVK